MDSDKLKYYEKELHKERDRVLTLIKKMKENEISDMYEEMADELSTFDNHPGDLGSIRSDIERGAYLKDNEFNILKKVNDALREIEIGTYGKCKVCGKDISEERLKVVPYATSCVDCTGKSR